jgi:enterochelin esterase-like enzyme
VQQPPLAEEVQQTDPGDDRDGGQEPAGDRAGKEDEVRLPAAALVTLFLAVGVTGAYSYVHDYYVYRGFPAATDPAGVPAGQVQFVHFYSPALHQRRVSVVYTPPGYPGEAARGVRFPVLYLLHAPPGHPENYIKAGALNVRLDELILAHRIPPYIVVMPNGRSGTYGNDTEWANTPRAGRWEDYLLDVARGVDRRYSTIRSRRARAIAGLSEGGYAAANVALHHLRTFGAFESWSGYFVQTPTLSFGGASPALLRANSPLDYVAGLRREIRRLGLHAYLYQGAHDDVSRVRLRRFVQRLRQAGAVVGWHVYHGGHNWALWRSQLPHMLIWIGDVFARAEGRAAVQGPGHTLVARVGA